MGKLLTTLIIFIAFTAVNTSAQDTFTPWDFNNPGPQQLEGAGPAKMSPGAKILTGGLHFYREYISQVDGERCKMYPSCSAYALAAIKKHGFFLGYMMTADRLIHESNEMDTAPKIKLKNGKERFYDPVEANDFWWSGNR